MEYRTRSFWLDSLTDDPLTPRPSLPADVDVDVAIVGAGFTGLWTAYYLKRARPQLRIVVLEREHAGFGASGRNGGWLSSGFAAPRAAMARTHGRDGVLALQRAMRGAVDEVQGPVRFHPRELKATPSTLARSEVRYAQGVLHWQQFSAGFLDLDLLFSNLHRNLA
jgi:glycine/D-amino acid oxidase-like deaminating enzyme